MANITRYFKLNRRGESQAHVVYAVTFTIIAVVALVGLIMVNTEADNSQQSTTVSNVAPSIADLQYGVSATSDITTLNILNLGGSTSGEGTRFTSVVTATVTDNNGCGDIDTATNYGLKLYRVTTTSGESDGAACTSTNGTSCYVGEATSLNLGSCSGTTAYNASNGFSWPVTTYYFMDVTDSGAYSSQNWGARLAVSDEGGAAVVTATDTFEVTSALGLDVDSTTDFGTLALGASSGSVALTIKNTGNVAEDYTTAYNTPMQCTQGSFSGSQVKLTQSAATAIGSAIASAATGSPRTVNASIAKATSMATSSTDPLYAYITIPSTAGVRGNCSNTATYTAIADGSTDDGI